MNIKYVSPIGEKLFIKEIQGFKLDGFLGLPCTCGVCNKTFDTGRETPGTLVIENKDTYEKRTYYVCRDCSLGILQRLRRIEDAQIHNS